MDFATRWRGAWRLLAGRGDGAVTCSFCGQGSRDVERVIAGPGATAICNRCIFLCNEFLLEHSGDHRFAPHAEGEHENTIGIELGHDEFTLDTAERVALEPLLLALVATLPASRLLGWRYMHGKDRFDLLTIDIVTTSGVAPDQLRERANEGWRRMRDAWLDARRKPANADTPELMEQGAAAVAASQRYAEAIAAVGRA